MPRDERYSRQIRFAPIGAAGQQRLQTSRVLVVGLGALGSVAADQIIRAGVGFVRLVDRDFVELSNLQRQSLFDEEDIRSNLPKAAAAEAKLRRVNSSVQIEARVDDVNPANIEDYIADVDLVLDPETPVVVRPRDERFRSAIEHERIELAHEWIALAHREPGVAGARPTRWYSSQVEAGAAIHRSLRDWVAAQLAILRVAPRSFVPIELIVASGPV